MACTLMADGATLPIRDCARASGARFAITSSTKLRVTRDPNMKSSAKLRVVARVVVVLVLVTIGGGLVVEAGFKLSDPILELLLNLGP